MNKQLQNTPAGIAYHYSQFFKFIDTNKYEYTDFFLYTAARKAKDYFAEIIKELDTDGRYTRTATKEFRDYEATNAQMAPYKAQLEEVERRMQEYKLNHLDEYDEQYRVDTNGQGGAGIRLSIPKNIFNLEDAVQGYLVAKQILSEIDNNSLPQYRAYMSKEEFAEKHKELRKKYMTELQIPEFEPIYVTDTRTSLKRWKNADSVITTEEPFELFCEYFEEDIIS